MYNSYPRYYLQEKVVLVLIKLEYSFKVIITLGENLLHALSAITKISRTKRALYQFNNFIETPPRFLLDKVIQGEYELGKCIMSDLLVSLLVQL